MSYTILIACLAAGWALLSFMGSAEATTPKSVTKTSASSESRAA